MKPGNLPFSQVSLAQIRAKSQHFPLPPFDHSLIVYHIYKYETTELFSDGIGTIRV